MTSTSIPLQRFLDRLLRRSVLAPDDRDAILALSGQEMRVRAGADIVSPGQATSRACLVVDGIVGRFGQVPDGRRQITAFHIAGDICDLHSVVFPKAGSAIQALTAATVLQIPHPQLRSIARDRPAIAEAFWRDCAVDASILSQWVVNVGRRNAIARMAHLLCEVGTRMEQADLGTRTAFDLPITQPLLADALGLTGVHVNRVLQALRREELIVADGHEVQILDWARLSRRGEFDDGYLEIGPPPA